MPEHVVVVVGLITAAFVLFGVTLAGVVFYSSRGPRNGTS